MYRVPKNSIKYYTIPCITRKMSPSLRPNSKLVLPTRAECKRRAMRRRTGRRDIPKRPFSLFVPPSFNDKKSSTKSLKCTQGTLSCVVYAIIFLGTRCTGAIWVGLCSRLPRLHIPRALMLGRLLTLSCSTLRCEGTFFTGAYTIFIKYVYQVHILPHCRMEGFTT